MLKLVDVLDMKYDDIVELYNYYQSIGCKNYDYSFFEIDNGEEEYYKYVVYPGCYKYFLVDDSNDNYIIGYGKINDFKDVDYHNVCDTGNISYHIRPNERNKGYGTKILELLLLKCEEIGMSEVFVSCLTNNIASRNIIENNGGIFEKEFYDDFEGYGFKYWFNLNPKFHNKLRRLIR